MGGARLLLFIVDVCIYRKIEVYYHIPIRIWVCDRIIVSITKRQSQMVRFRGLGHDFFYRALKTDERQNCRLSRLFSQQWGWRLQSRKKKYLILVKTVSTYCVQYKKCVFCRLFVSEIERIVFVKYVNSLFFLFFLFAMARCTFNATLNARDQVEQCLLPVDLQLSCGSDKQGRALSECCYKHFDYFSVTSEISYDVIICWPLVCMCVCVCSPLYREPIVACT